MKIKAYFFGWAFSTLILPFFQRILAVRMLRGIAITTNKPAIDVPAIPRMEREESKNQRAKESPALYSVLFL